MKNIIYYAAFMASLLLGSCDDIETHKPYGPEGTKPETVTVTSYEKIPGGVKVKFVVPSNNDLLYVKFKYKLDNGKDMEARASLYSNEVEIEGFGNTEPKALTVSAVNRMDEEGESITTEVIPGTPACITAVDEMQTSATFGGIFVQTKNEHSNYLCFDISVKDEKDEWYVTHTEYTSVKDIKFALRGFDSTPRDFKIQVRDLYDNKSEEYVTTLTPLYEERLDLSKFKEFRLPNDLPVNGSYPMKNLWNGNNKWGAFNLYHSQNFNPTDFPVWFTFDMGQVATLSRFTCWQRLMSDGAFLYGEGSIKNFEIWGCATTPPSDGSWDGWVKLMDCESIKPSGWPAGSVSDEDKEWARNGEEFEFPNGIPPVRYIRVKVLSTHTGAGLVVMQQMWFYGTPENKK